ncbi:MAG: DUF4349 domain-containing protein [Oscillospiraceae bacterium]|nr:DUF4349 domain-containing protein [Oscillospiraceae bacterium]
MKIKSALPIILSALILTACGSSEMAASESYSMGAKSSSYSGAAVNSSDNYSYEEGSYDMADAESYDASSNSAGDENGLTSEKIRKEMLVYTCNMTVDVLNFDEAIGQFKESLDSFGGFVETENYSDGGGSNRWYNENEEKWQSYSATVRVPSSEYDAFCLAASELGDLRSKNAAVENVSSEYYDLYTTLEIYEAKEQRYIDLLADITDDAYAVTVEKELTELQIEIARIKTRMNKIQTDVAYSFVNITINEVKEYKAEPIKKDTFGERLMNTVSDTASNFLIFLEGLLFLIISLFPYLVLIGIIVVIIISIRRRIKTKKAQKSETLSAPEQETAKSEDKKSE